MTKREFQVIKRKKNDVTGVAGMSFGTHGAFTVSDPGLAHEIDQIHGVKGTGDVVVAENPRTPYDARSEGGVHHYTFTMPGKTWTTEKPATWEEFRPGRFRLKKE